MNNRPYIPTLLDELSTFQLKRLEAAETALVQMAALVGRNFPALKPSVDEILTNASNGVFSAEEAAARLYLRRLYGTDHGAKAEALQASNTAAINELISSYFPVYMGRPSPLAFATEELLTVMNSAQVFPDDSSIAFATLNDALEGSYLTDETSGGLWRTRLIDPLDRTVPTLILGTGPRQYFAIAPQHGLQAVLEMDNENQHYFTHHQTQYVNVGVLETALKNNFLKILTPAIRSHYALKGDVVTKVQVLITQIAKLFDPAKLKEAIPLNFHQGYFQASVSCNATWKVENITQHALYLKASHTDIEALIDVTRTEAVLFKIGNQLIAVKYEELPTVSLTILEKVLGEVLAALKPKKVRKATV